MKYLYFVFMYALLCADTYCQSAQVELSQVDEYYCLEWLTDFRDTIIVTTEISRIPTNRRYCVIAQENKWKHLFWCWTGKLALETPTISRKRFRVRYINDDRLIYKLGKEKYYYSISRNNSGMIYLLKE